MGWHITKQPNGLYAYYDTEYDIFRHYNLTELDVQALVILKQIRMAQGEAQQALATANQEGQARYEEDLEIIEEDETQSPEELQVVRSRMENLPPTDPAPSSVILRRLLTTVEDLLHQYEQVEQ